MEIGGSILIETNSDVIDNPPANGALLLKLSSAQDHGTKTVTDALTPPEAAVILADPGKRPDVTRPVGVTPATGKLLVVQITGIVNT